MAVEMENGELLGWVLIDLDDPAPKRAYYIMEALGLPVEQFIDEAIAEKVARWDAENGGASSESP